MKVGKFQFLILISWVISNPILHRASADDINATPTPSLTPSLPPLYHQGELIQNSTPLFDQKTEVGQQNTTYRLLDQQEHQQEQHTQSMGDQLTDLAVGKDRATAMVDMLKNAEMKRALDKVTVRGNEFLQENSEIKGVVGVAAGAFALWTGRTIKLIQSSQFKLNTQVQGRNESAGMMVESPLMNGALKFDKSAGLNMNLNRSIASLNSSAQLNYNLNNKSISSQISHHLSPHVDLTFGTSQNTTTNQIDNNASLNYHFSF